MQNTVGSSSHGQVGKPVYNVGPQLPDIIEDEWTIEGRKGEHKDYLDASPDRSVIYIRYTIRLLERLRYELIGQNSFGSVLYAPSHDQVRIVLDVFEELGVRYIMGEGNAPEETKAMIRARVGKGKDKGLCVTWAPQRAILSHKVGFQRLPPSFPLVRLCL